MSETVSLSKGGNVSLTKSNPGLSKIKIGLGWDTAEGTGHDFDLDASLFMVASTGKVRTEKDFIFYGRLTSECTSVTHTGDNLTGEGEGDDEAIIVDLTKVPADVDKLVVAVTIHEAGARGQNFGQVENSFARVVNEATNEEIARYDLREDFSTETAITATEIYRNNGEWKMRAIGVGVNGGLADIANKYGVATN